MRPLVGIIPLAFLLNAAALPCFTQLRNLSPYAQDCINTEQTYFTLHDSNTADFAWASEWTHMTVNTYADKTAILLWHFKNGSKAYTQQGDIIGDAGMVTGYLLTQKSSNLEDRNHNKIQPMTRTNFPVRLELWIGEAGNPAGFTPETLVDAVCLNAEAIEYDRPYHFSRCPGAD